MDHVLRTTDVADAGRRLGAGAGRGQHRAPCRRAGRAASSSASAPRTRRRRPRRWPRSTPRASPSSSRLRPTPAGARWACWARSRSRRCCWSPALARGGSRWFAGRLGGGGARSDTVSGGARSPRSPCTQDMAHAVMNGVAALMFFSAVGRWMGAGLGALAHRRVGVAGEPAGRRAATSPTSCRSARRRRRSRRWAWWPGSRSRGGCGCARAAATPGCRWARPWRCSR